MTDQPPRRKRTRATPKQIYLPDSLWQWAKIQAVNERTTASAIVRRALVAERSRLEPL